jgi:hypothetical protein
VLTNDLIVAARTQNSVVTAMGATIRDSQARKSIAWPEKPVCDSFPSGCPVLNLPPHWAWTPDEFVPKSDVVS